MATLYVRDVPESVSEVLKARAQELGMSLSSYIARQLADLAAAPTNAEIADRLRRRRRTGGPTSDEIVALIRQARDA